MNVYFCVYKGVELRVEAPTRADAYSKAIDYFKPLRKKRHLINVVLAEKDIVTE